MSRRCTHAFTPRRGACTRHSSSPDSHTDGQPSEERRVIHVRGTGCCPSLPLSPVKIHGQFSLISNDVSKREEGRDKGPTVRRIESGILCALLSLPPFSFLLAPFPLSFPVVRRTWIELLSDARLLYTHKSIYVLVYSGGRGTFEHSFSISRFLSRFLSLSLSHTQALSISLSLSIKRRDAHVFRE